MIVAGENHGRVRNVVGFRNEIERFPCHLHLFERRGTVYDAEICGIRVINGAKRRIDERYGSVRKRLPLNQEPVHGSSVDSDAEVFFHIGADDVF